MKEADRERFTRQIRFLVEMDKMKNIYRQTRVLHEDRAENDAEHAWHLAMLALVLSEYANEPVDLKKVLATVLIHDVVEIDAGDTYAYDEENLKTQKAREDAAKERIYSILPEDQKKELIALFDEFENYASPEARFARAMDNIQPLILNVSNDGGDWKEHAVTSKNVYGRQSKTKLGSETLYEAADELIQDQIKKGNLPE